MRSLIARLLREDGHEVHGASDCIEFQRIMETMPIGLILLETALPRKDGFTLCAEIRRNRNTPIMFVSAASQEADRVKALDLGADDYLSKPFGRSELPARVRALLRRSHGQTSITLPSMAARYLFAEWRYDLKRRELLSPIGTEVSLTTSEHALLRALLRNPQRTIPRERLLEMSSARTSDPSNRSIDVLVSRLRRKLSDGRRSQPMIRTVRGVGYVFTPEVEADHASAA